MRCDMWRALITWLEGGVYADVDTVLKRPLREIIKSDDDAVSGVGHSHHGLEQFVLVYSPRHPIMLRLLQQMLAEIRRRGVGHIKGWSVMSVTGPYMLQRVTSELLLNGRTTAPHFTDDGGVYPVNASTGTARTMRILPGRYACSVKQPYCGDVGTFGGSVLFKYDGYESDQTKIGGKSYHRG